MWEAVTAATRSASAAAAWTPTEPNERSQREWGACRQRSVLRRLPGLDAPLGRLDR